MAMRFLESFDLYATADILKKWTGGLLTQFSSNTITIGAFGRNSTQGLRITYVDSNAFINLTKTLAPSGSTLIVGFAFRTNKLHATSSRNQVFSIYDASTQQFSFRVNSDGTLSILRGSYAGTVLGTTTVALSLDTYYYLEVKVLLHTSAGTFDVRVNGTSAVSGTGVNTAGAGTTTWNVLRLGSDGNANADATQNFDFDDLYVNDGSGSEHNDFIDPIRVPVKRPTGAGTTTQMTPSAGSNWQNVDDTTMDSDTTYNAETTAGDLDLYTFGALGLTGTVKALQTALCFRSDGAGAETLAPMIRISSTNYQGTTVGCTTTYAFSNQIYPTSPATSAAWTVSELDGAEYGVKLVS
jgi:hypothetical protein